MAPELILVNFLDCEWSCFRHLALTSFYWKLNMLIKLWSFFSMLLLPPAILDDWCKMWQNLNVVVPSRRLLWLIEMFDKLDWKRMPVRSVQVSVSLPSVCNDRPDTKNTNQNLLYQFSYGNSVNPVTGKCDGTSHKKVLPKLNDWIIFKGYF